MSWMFNNLYISKLFLYIIAMKELSVTEAREQFPALLNQAAKKPVWITRHGVDVAVVISPELFEELVSAQEELLLMRRCWIRVQEFLGNKCKKT